MRRAVELRGVEVDVVEVDAPHDLEPGSGDDAVSEGRLRRLSGGAARENLTPAPARPHFTR